jgi:phosphomannomutase
VTIPAELLARVEAWIAHDPDPDTVTEAAALLKSGDEAALRERFDDRLAFGTAGLRGPLGAGPNRMNELVVRQTAAGLADYVMQAVPEAVTRGVVIGYDARHKSHRFAAATARVFAAKGMRALLFPHHVPTPVLAYSVLDLGVAVGVQVTASHNPPADNGYKVYWGDGPQIVPPLDEFIAAAINAVAVEPAAVILSTPTDPLIETLTDEVIDRYHAGVAGLDPRTSDAAARACLRIVYTAMHGVGGADLMRTLGAAGFTSVAPVAEQFAPDPDFPTVAFPNPEEKGALDLALGLAVAMSADLILANDPDADRMAAAIPDPAGPGGWRPLRGDEIGWLLADHLLRQPAKDGTRRLVCTTIVSSSLLSIMAARYDVEYRETLTGFKWLARKALEENKYAHVLSYEEALGYCVGSLVRDKDGISAALVMADLAATLKAAGSSVRDRLVELEATYGRFDTEQWSLRFDGADAQQKMKALMDGLRANLPAEVAGVALREVRDLAGASPAADVVILNLTDGGRITIRPSGTEPKCKVYFETVTRPGTEPVPISELKESMARILAVTA